MGCTFANPFGTRCCFECKESHCEDRCLGMPNPSNECEHFSSNNYDNCINDETVEVI